MKIPKSIALLCLLPAFAFAFAFAFGCASTTYEGNNNSPGNNNTPPTDGGTNSNGSACQATCSGSNLCVGQPDHQTCVPECESGLTCADPLRTCCYGGCVDLQNDPNNCGSCASFCDGNCINGVCVDPCGNMCATDQTCCGGTCTNTTSDMNNCGACGSICDSEESNSCVNGTCKCGSSNACDVASGAECCTTSCKYVATDVTNCGGCGIACAIGETCQNGSCMCGSGAACTGTQGCCGSQCVEMNTSQYCGSCTTSCTSPDTCNGGVCNCGGEVCDPGYPPILPGGCCGSGGCIQFQGLGVANCGACNAPCAGICLVGVCQ